MGFIWNQEDSDFGYIIYLLKLLKYNNLDKFRDILLTFFNQILIEYHHFGLKIPHTINIYVLPLLYTNICLSMCEHKYAIVMKASQIIKPLCERIHLGWEGDEAGITPLTQASIISEFESTCSHQ